LTMLAMLALLGLLILTYLRMGIGLQPVPAAERWLVQLPISIYLGWISVATIANASVFLVDQGWSGWGLGAATWTVIMIAAAIVIGSAMVLRRGEVAFPLVLTWALIGIAVRNAGLPLVEVTAWVAAAAALAAAVWSAIRSPRQPASA